MKKTKTVSFILSFILFFFILLFCKQECFAASEVGKTTGKNGVVYTLYSDGTALASDYKGEDWLSDIQLSQSVKFKNKNYRVRGIADYGLYYTKDDKACLTVRREVRVYFCKDLYLGTHCVSNYCKSVRVSTSDTMYQDLTESTDRFIENLIEDTINNNLKMRLATGFYAYQNEQRKTQSDYFQNFFAKIAEQYYAFKWGDQTIFPKSDPDAEDTFPYKDLLRQSNVKNMEQYIKKIVSNNEYDSTSKKSDDKYITKTSWWANSSKTRAKTEIDCGISTNYNQSFDFLIVADVTSSLFNFANGSDSFSMDLIEYGQIVQLIDKLAKNQNNRIGVLTFSNADHVNASISDSKNNLGKNDGTIHFDKDAGFSKIDQVNYDTYISQLRRYFPKYVDAGTDYAATLKKVYSNYFNQRKDKSRTPVIIFMSDGNPEAAGCKNYDAKANSDTGLQGIGNTFKQQGITVKGIALCDSMAVFTISNLCQSFGDVAYGNSSDEIIKAFQKTISDIIGNVSITDTINTNKFDIEKVTYTTVDGSLAGVITPTNGRFNLSLPLSKANGKTIKISIDLSLKDKTLCTKNILTNSSDASISFDNKNTSTLSPILSRYRINVRKKDNDGKDLSNAHFVLKDKNNSTLYFEKYFNSDDQKYYYIFSGFSDDKNNPMLTSDLVSDDDGLIRLCALPNATNKATASFTLQETACPEGYLVSSNLPTQISLGGHRGSDTNGKLSIPVVNNIATRQLVLEKCFEVGNLTDAEVLEKASAIKLIVSGTKVNGEPYNSSTYTITKSSFSHKYSYIDNKRYVCFYRIIPVPAGQYTVTEDISNENFFNNNGTYVSSDTAKSSSDNLYYASSSIIAELLKGKPTKSIQVDLSASNQYVFFLNTIKTTNLDIDKVISSNNREDHQNNNYTFEIQGTDLLNQTFVWSFSSADIFHKNIKSVSKYKLDSKGNKIATKENNGIASQWTEWSPNTKGYKYSLYNLPYSPTGYTVKESSSSANFDITKTKVYNNEDDFKNNKNGTNTYIANASLDNNFTTYFRNTVVGKIVVNKTSEDNFVSGFKFTLKGNGKSLTVATDSKGQAVFNNIPIYDDTGSAITYEIVETEIPRRYDTPSYKMNGTTLVKNKISGMYSIGSLNTNKSITVDVSNTLKKATLNIEKTFNGKNIASESENFAGIKFYIYQYSSSGKLISTKVDTTDNNGEISLSNLPIYDRDNKAYKYTIKEDPKISKKFSSVSYSTDPSSVNNVSSFRFSNLRSTVTFYVNNETTSNLIIEKKDANTQEPLSQAEFCLYTKENPNTPLNFEKTKESNYTYVSKQTNSSVNKLVCIDGVLTITDLPNGSYLVKEIKAPANYEISEAQPKEVTLRNSSGQTVVFYDKLLGQKVKIFKFAEDFEGLLYSDKQLTNEKKELLKERLFNTKFKISGTTQSNLTYEKELTIDSSWKLTNIAITKNYQRRAWGYYTEIEVPYGKYSISEIASSDMFDLSKTNIRKTNEIIASSSSNEDWNSWTKDYLFQNTSEVINNKNANVDFPVDTSTTNESIIFYNKFKTYPVNIYKVINASSLKEALMVAKDTSFKLTGSVFKTVPSITKTNNGKIELNTDGGWTISNKVINDFGSSPYYCFKYTVDNVNASKQLSIQEYAGENCDKKLSFASMKNSRLAIYGSSLYNEKTGDLDPFIVKNDAFDKDSKDVYFFNSPKRNVLNIVKSANMFTTPNDSSEISEKTVLNSLRGTEFYISGKDYLGQEVNKVVTINDDWIIDQNSKDQYYAFYQVKGSDGGYPLKGNYKITEVLPGDTDFVAEKTKVYNYTVPSGESIEGLTSYYEDMRGFTVSQSTNCNTLEGPICAAFYNVKDYVSLAINKYTDVSTGGKVLTKAELIKLLDGTKFRISGITASGQEYSKTIVINEENQALFDLSFDSSSGPTYGSYLECILKVPRPKDSYTIEEIESPNYDLSKTVSWFGSYNNKKTSTIIELPLGSKENESKTRFSCSFYNKQKTINLTIYKILDYDGIVLDNETDLTKAEEKTIINYFKDLKFDISCDAFYGTYKTSLSTNSTSLWNVGYANNRVYIYANIAVPLGKCTITETAANGSMEHKYFDLSQTSVSKFFTDALYPEKYSNSIVETYTGDISSSSVFFANRLKTKKIKVALFGDGANKAEDAKELLNESRFKIVANSTVSGVPYQTREIVFYKNRITASPVADSNDLKFEYYTSSDGTVYSGLSYAEITVPEGNYSVTETASNDFYDLSKTTYAWDAKNAILGQKVGTTYTKDVTSTANATAKTFGFYFYNRYSLGDIIVKKIDSETKTPIAGVEFKLLNKKAQTLKFKQDTAYTDENPVYVLDGTNGSEVLKTGVNGTFTIKDMAYGIYYLSETSTNVDYTPIENEIVLKLTSPTITKEVPNSLKQETLRIVKAAEDISADTTDGNTILKGLTFNIEGTQKNGQSYKNSIVIDENTAINHGLINDSAYFYFDVKVPLGSYTVTEDTSNAPKYAADKIYTADSIEKIFDENNRALGNSVNVVVDSLDTTTEDDNIADTACFYNTLNYAKLQLYKFVPNVKNTSYLKQLLSGTKFIVEGMNGSSYYQEFIIDPQNLTWTPTSASANGEIYRGYKLASYITLPIGKYNVKEVVNDNFDESKTLAGWSVANALSGTPRTSYEITMTSTTVTYNRTFINYPKTTTVRIGKTADNTFDSVSDANVRKYLEGLQFTFKDNMFGSNGYNKTITIDSSWKLGKSNGYKYLYKDIDVLASNYTVTEGIGNNVYYDANLTKTYTAKTIQDVLDGSKRIQSNIASLNVASNESELYFFNTANPTKLTLYKAIEGDITNAIKLVAGTKFVLTNETDGSTTTIVVPEEYNVADSLGGKWSVSKRTLETGETYTVLAYAVMGLTPGNYTITEIPNSNFSSSKIYAANTLKNANQKKIDGTSSNSYSFIHSKPFVQSADVTPIVFINTIATQTIRISKVANNTFSNLSNSTVLNYLNGLQFDIKNTTISSGEFDKTVTIDNTWSVATNGQYKYVYKDIEVPAGIYTVEETIGSNTTFDANLNETYYQSSIENVLDKNLRQKGTKGAVTTSENANEICFFNTASPTNYMMIYKAIKGYTNKAAMLDLVKGTKFKVTNIIDNSSFVVTVGENAYTVNDKYGRKWGYFSKVVEDDTYTVMSYKIEGLPLGRYIVKEFPNNNFDASQIRVSSNLTNATKADFKDNITLTAHKPNTILTSAFINPLTTKTIRIAKLADNVYDSTSDKNVRTYLNGLQFKISDNYFEDGYSETLTIDDSWTIVKDDSKKLKYVYKDIEVPVSSYSVEETKGTNTIYDLDKTYNQKTLDDVTNKANRILGTKATVNITNNETEAYFYNTTKPSKFIIDKSVEGVNSEAELHRLIDGTKFVITNKKTSESITYTVDSTWKYKLNTSSTTGKKYGTLYKELNLNASVYSIEEIVNDNFEQNKVKVGWSIEKAEEELYSNPTTFTIANPKSSIARYFINTLKTSTIKLVKVADITTSNVKDSVVYDVLKGLDINVKSNNYNKTYTIDNSWTIASGNGYKYLYKEITVPYGKYTITETTGSNTLFDMSNVFNSEDLSKVTNSKQRSKGSSFQLVVDSSSESAYIYNVAKLSNVRLVKETDHAPEAYMRQVVNGTIFTVTGTDFVGRSVKETFTINNSWKYSVATINSKEYSYLYYDIKLLPGSYTIKETPSSSCDASKITAGAGLSKAINSTTHTNTITLKINAASESYWRVFYNHLKESILYLSKIGSNISSTASAANTHKYLDGLQFKIEGKTALGQTYSQTFKIDSSWYLGTAGNYRKLTHNVTLPYGTYTITETSGNNTNYDLSKTQFAFNSKDILDPNKRQLGTSTSITVSNTNSYGAVFFNIVKEKPEYSVSNTTASTPGSNHVGIINTHIKNGATESYNEGKNVPVVVLLRDKDGNVVTIAQQKVDLKPQEEKDLTFSITYPSNISPEEYEIEVRINWDNRNSEQNSNNNKDITTINPYDFSMDDVGLKSNKASVGGKISLVPKISYNGAKAFTDNSATLQFYVLDGAGNQIGDMLSEIPLNSISSLLDSNGKLNIEPGSSWTIGSDSSPLVLTLPGELSSNTEYNILARVNWVNRTKELNANNNEKISSFKSVNNIDIKIEPVYPNSSYYVGTEVISTYIVDNQSNSFDVYPGYLEAKFSVTALFPDGSTKVVPLDASNSTKNVVVPQKSTGIVYFKWTIPEKVDGVSLVGASLTCNATLLPQTFEDSDPSNDTANIVKKVYEFDVSHANDTNYEKDSSAAMDALKADHSAEGIKISNFVEKAIDAMNSFDKKTTRQGDDDLSVFQYKNQASWDEWSYDRSNGFRLTTYRANLKNSVSLGADTAHMAKASSSASSNIKEFKSGYGFGVETNASINKIGLSLPTGSYTNAQYSACFFPEYLFSDKKGEYETLVYNTTKKAFEIANNKYGNNLHYTPIWYPDIVSDRGNYPVAVEFTQCWTPAGVISSKHTDNSIKINGNIYDDWYQQQH